ncbi:MAG: cation diffusion facilitator family transporter [Petrimonas sp.]|nr:cation diffusion facilitator family transporter [Petrimonas sp.]
MSNQNASTKSILFALLANLGIAITKTVAAVLTGSGSMLAEAIHSYADCGNQLLLFFGLKQSKRAPEENHPLGHGKEIYFWSFVVALMLFSMGGLFSIYEGIHKLSAQEELKSPMIAIVVLAVSIVLEGASLTGCIKQIHKVKKNGVSLWQWTKETRKSELVVVLGEDIAAIVGLTFALLAITLAMITGNPVFDAIGSIGIGTLLVFVSLFIGFKVKGLLIGQSVDRDTRDEINNLLASLPEIEKVFNVITLQMGEDIMVSVKAKMTETESAERLLMDVNKCEQALKASNQAIDWVFFEPDISD